MGESGLDIVLRHVRPVKNFELASIACSSRFYRPAGIDDFSELESLACGAGPRLIAVFGWLIPGWSSK